MYYTGYLLSKVHLEEQVMRGNEQSQSELCVHSVKWERALSKACAGWTPGTVWYAGLDGAGELPFPYKPYIVRSDLEMFSAARWDDADVNFWLQ